MIIGVNVLYLKPGMVGGSETYARELVCSMVRQFPDHHFVVYCGRGVETVFGLAPNMTVVVLPFDPENRLVRLAWEQCALSLYCLSDKLDVLLSLGYTQPLVLPCKSIVTIHDLNWYYQPDDFSRTARFMWQTLVTLSAKRANAIIAVSQSTQKSLHSVLRIPLAKMKVVYHGIPPYRAVGKSSIQKVRAAYTLPRRYILTVLSHYPHKNITTVLEVHKLVQKQNPDIGLVIAGSGSESERSARRAYLRAQGVHQGIVLPYVSVDQLAAVYQGAEVFVFPSKYEGFGLPVLEAMAHRVPVVSSNAYSLSEIVGDAGILIDPMDTKGMADAIETVIASKSIRQQLIEKGERRVKRFTWERAARETIELVGEI